MERLNIGIEILKQWEQYVDTHANRDLAQFGAWLQLNNSTDKVEPMDDVLAQAPPEVLGSANLLDAQIAFTWGRLMRYTQIWAKRVFADTPIRTMDEFGLLMFIFQANGPKKSEVAQQSLMEQTTCFEIIKRFQRQGLVEEFPDPDDRRSRRVRLSNEAIQMVGMVLRQRAEQMSSLLFGHLSANQKTLLWDLFEPLDRFHSNTLKAHPDTPVEDILKGL